MAPIPRVALANLLTPVAHSKWEECVEAVSVSMSKHNVVVLKLPDFDAAHLQLAISALPSLFSAPERSSPDQTPAPLTGLFSAPGLERFDLRIGAESTTSLPESTRTIFCEVRTPGNFPERRPDRRGVCDARGQHLNHRNRTHFDFWHRAPAVEVEAFYFRGFRSGKAQQGLIQKGQPHLRPDNRPCYEGLST